MKKALLLVIPILGCFLNTVSDVRAQQSMMRPQDLESYRNQVQKCWVVPASTSATRVRVDVKVKLKSDGTLDGAPKVLNQSQDEAFKKIAGSVVLAFVRCQPFKLPVASYGTWKELEMAFEAGGAGP